MNTLILVSVCRINRKKFTSVPVKVMDINFHFHEQLLMSQDKTSYYLRVDGKWARDEILYCFPFSLHICSVKKTENRTKQKNQFGMARLFINHRGRVEG